MAIQVGGTTVVNDSRELQNIASLDTTTTNTIAAAASSDYTWQTATTISDSTERTSNHTVLNAITLPSDKIKGIGFNFDCDGKITTTSSYRWEVYVALSKFSTWGSVVNYARFNNFMNTSGYWPATNTYYDINCSMTTGVNSETYDSVNDTTVARALRRESHVVPSTSTSNPGYVSSSSYVLQHGKVLTWGGDYWGGNIFSPEFNPIGSDYPDLDPGDTIYFGFNWNPDSRSGVYIKNIVCKLKLLY